MAIVTGAGRAFCAGADLKDGAGAVGSWPGSFWEIPTINSYESGLELWKPTIAAVNGYCLGYGLTAVTRCDFVIAADDAEFGFPEVRLGVPTIVGALRLPDRVGWSNAMELLLTGDRIDAARAHEMGLVWKVVPGADLMDEAHRLADRLLQAAPLAGARDEGDGGAGSVAPVDRGGALRRDDAPGRGPHRGRGRGQPRRRRGPRPPLAGPLSLYSGRDQRQVQEMRGSACATLGTPCSQCACMAPPITSRSPVAGERSRDRPPPCGRTRNGRVPPSVTIATSPSSTSRSSRSRCGATESRPSR